MFVEAMKWREREDIDNIVETFPKNRYRCAVHRANGLFSVCCIHLECADTANC